MSDVDARVKDWTPNPGETVLARSRIDYATGAAAQVAGSRWFRNTDREDVQGELPGWPEGPEYVLHTPSQQAARKTGRFARVAIPALLNAAAELFGGAGSPFGNPEILGKPTEPENEVTDFPVMWAAPGTLARTFPWQLDPARRGKEHTTHVVVTDQRFVLLEQGPTAEHGPEVLQSYARDSVQGVEQMDFSTVRPDTRIRFVDGSWVRVSLVEHIEAFPHLRTRPELLREDELTGAQQDALATFRQRWAPSEEPPLLIRRGGSHVRVELRVPASRTRYGYLTQSLTMNAAGDRELPPTDGMEEPGLT
ncbi:hypothetical protein [Actinacidiphila acidipaludis]|uniref:Uncharacterized protein n=1 Tax=Actinacidiphila acidipaludis TaxID=2873382 RepID=A0ABS7QK25_9ACTN|nr:hypothetical protein [Streptomyces acidipaludis]MBY8882765.1 hypothetical protein [Streptomyces acidipaludis]